MRKLAVVCLLLVSGAAAAADAPTAERVDREAGGDRFSAGGSVSVSTPVAADLLAAGGNVDIDTRVGGDVVAAGGDVRIKGDVDSGVFAAGGQLRLDASVKRSVRVVGGQVEIGPKAQLGGNLSVAGGHVRVEGPVFGYVQAAGGDVTVDSAVGGDVWATGGHLTLGPNARIGGKVHYATHGGLTQNPAAVVKGGVEQVDFEAAWPRAHRQAHTPSGFGWVWVAGLMVLAAVLIGVAPSLTATASEVLKRRPWFALLIGFVILVCVPIAAIILLATVVGIPIALLVLLAYPILLLLGYELTAIGIGDWAMQRFAADRARSWGWRALAAAVAVLLISALGHVPFLGGIVAFLALLFGLGALALQWRRTPSAA